MRCAAAILLLLPATLFAAPPPITTTPANPTAGVPFQVNVTLAGCFDINTVTLNGTNIDITLNARFCPVEPAITTASALVAPLPAGTYTIRVLGIDSAVVASAPVVVGANVPALDPRLLVILAVAFLALALLRLRIAG
jgi:hypothetical protein